jgi:hypothetical protein
MWRGRARKELVNMRYGYWVDAVLGVILIVAPYVGKFAQDRAALYTAVAVGVLLLVWALIGYVNPGGQQAHGAHPTHA